MKRGNTVATVLLIAVLVAASGAYLQSQVFAPQTNFIDRTVNTFSQFVFEDPEEIVREYALSGYQAGSEYWYCGDYASPPTFDMTVQSFPEFASNLLSGRLETLKQELGDFNVEISEPHFAFTGVDGDVLVDTVVGVNVSDFTVTVRDGERIVGLEYDEQYQYALRYWQNYMIMYNWITTGNGGIYGIIDEVLEGRSCAFVKDQCFCATDNPDAYTDCEDVEEGELCNPCPCYKHNPVYTEEDCSTNNPLGCQDFVTSERNEIMNEYGINDNDLINIGERITQELEAQFTHDVSCTASISETNLQNGFASAYIIHPSPCPREQIGGTCGVVPMNIFDTILCASYSGGECQACPSPIGVSNRVGKSAFNNEALLNECIAGSNFLESTCDFINITNQETGEIQTVYGCENSLGSIVVLGTNESDVRIPSCNPTDTLPGSARGASGSNSLASPALFPEQCNSIPAGANHGPDDRAKEMLESGKFSATTTVKNLESIPDFTDFNVVWWEGTNGWIDRRGAMDLSISCFDEGDETVEQFETDIDLRLVFRHGCDTSLNRVQVITMETCGAAGDENLPSCQCPDDGNPCTSERCELNPDTGLEECIIEPLDGVFVPEPGNPCQRFMCKNGELNLGITEPVGAGSSCATGSAAYCNQCDGAGSCVPKEDGSSCFGSAGVCERTSCQAGACVAELSPDASCSGGSCGECECTETGPVYSSDASACDRLAPREEWVSCTQQQEFGYECISSETGRYNCELEGGSDFDTNVCCPSPGEGAEVCSTGQICCGGDFCSPSDSCNPE